MKTNQKGFTLIELLAVIIILAIIALIAVPTIMNIITSSKKSAAEDSAYGVLASAELWYANDLLVNKGKSAGATFGKAASDGIKAFTDLNIKGDNPTAGTITIASNGDVTFTKVEIKGHCITQANDGFSAKSGACPTT